MSRLNRSTPSSVGRTGSMKTQPAVVRRAYESKELMPVGGGPMENRISQGSVSVPNSTATRDCSIGSLLIAGVSTRR
jgi:hypothetical protein